MKDQTDQIVHGGSWLNRIRQVLAREPGDRVELVELLRTAQHQGLFDTDALTMIEGVLQVSEMQVRDIMIPRSQMVVVARETRPDEFLPVVVGSGHSRFPVIGESRDEVVGILLAKDLLRYTDELQRNVFNVREVLRPAVFIPESKRLNILLKEFRSSRNHMAIVVDEYGGVSGIVTIEDVLEQIVGEIEDEHDVEEDAYIIEHSPTHYTVNALTFIEDFNEYFNTRFSDDGFDTIGGLVTNRIGHLPKRGERVTIDNMLFKVARANKRRILFLDLTVLPPRVDAVPDDAG
jgi:magnesium and cobalt transporter